MQSAKVTSNVYFTLAFTLNVCYHTIVQREKHKAKRQRADLAGGVRKSINHATL